MNTESYEIDAVELERDADLVMGQLIRAWEGNRIEKRQYYALLDQRQELLKSAYTMLDNINQRLNLAMNDPMKRLPPDVYHRIVAIRQIVRAAIKKLKHYVSGI